MSLHAFIDESTRGRRYLICATTISPTEVHPARRALRTMLASGQRRIHFATESDRRRRAFLKEISALGARSVVFVANHSNQVVARAAIIATLVPKLRQAGVSRLVLEAREGQDGQDRAVIYRALGPHPEPPLSYVHHRSASEPMLWVPDAVTWAWGRGGSWRKRVEDLGLVGAVVMVNTS